MWMEVGRGMPSVFMLMRLENLVVHGHARALINTRQIIPIYGGEWQHDCHPSSVRVRGPSIISFALRLQMVRYLTLCLGVFQRVPGAGGVTTKKIFLGLKSVHLLSIGSNKAFGIYAASQLTENTTGSGERHVRRSTQHGQRSDAR